MTVNSSEADLFSIIFLISDFANSFPRTAKLNKEIIFSACSAVRMAKI
jgi:hypothetical protein